MIRRPPRSTLFPLHDALPISFISEIIQGEEISMTGIDERKPLAERKTEDIGRRTLLAFLLLAVWVPALFGQTAADRKSTRLNSSHGYISYAVFCLKKKTTQNN